MVRSLGLPEYISNGITIVLVVFAGLTVVTDRQRDHSTPSIAIGRI